MSLFEALFVYHLRMFYKDTYESQSKSQIANKNIAVLRNLMKELKINLAGSQEL